MRWIVGALSAIVLCLAGVLTLAPGLLLPGRTPSYEARAIGALKTICTTQSLFRERRRRPPEDPTVFDYARSLQELGESSLIDLAAGKRNGYRFTLIASDEHPEFLWMAVASPDPSIREHAQRHFAINQAGVIHYSYDGPIPLTPDCTIPPRFMPVGK